MSLLKEAKSEQPCEQKVLGLSQMIRAKFLTCGQSLYQQVLLIVMPWKHGFTVCTTKARLTQVTLVLRLVL